MNQKPITSAVPTTTMSTASTTSSSLSDDDELQRAIDDITNKDPFLDEAKSQPSSQPIKPFSPDNPTPIEAPFPTLQPPEEPKMPDPFEFTPTPIEQDHSPNIETATIPSPKTAPKPPLTQPNDNLAPTPNFPTQTPDIIPAPASDLEQDEATTFSPSSKNPVKPTEGAKELKDIKEKALDALIPLLDKINASPEKIFQIYRGYIESGHNDPSIIKSAFEAANTIKDDAVRADALFFIFDHLDK